jgi:AmmeMemoRadiSam system protein B
LEERCGDLCAYELDHLREHSIELQVAWLQHLFGADSCTIVPFLCPDPSGPTGTAPADGEGVDLREFAEVLGELIAEDGRDTLLVAGADLSHVGAAFGDSRRLDDAFLDEIRTHDTRALDKLMDNDPGGWVACVAQDENPTRICSAGSIFVLATVLRDASCTLLQYHQAVDEPSQTCVTCAAVVCS